MSQILPTILLHTQKYVLFNFKKSTYFRAQFKEANKNAATFLFFREYSFIFQGVTKKKTVLQKKEVIFVCVS